MAIITAPERSETSEYYFTYIDRVGRGDICTILEDQVTPTVAFFENISEARSLFRYAPDKWSIRQVLGHLNDAERLFVFRAFWFARGFETPLPSFDQHVAIATAAGDGRSWRSHIDEFTTVRRSTLSFFQNLPADAWDRRGIASENPFTVRALAFLAAGHLMHHLEILRTRYQ
jgi:DinB family protein